MDSPAALGGPWTAADHAAHPSFDEPLARALVVMFAPVEQDGVIDWGCGDVTVIDWGGGMGLYLDAIREAGAWTVVVEPKIDPPCHGHRFYRDDMAAGDIWIHSARAPYLSLCLEVLEHIPRDRHAIAFDNVCRYIVPGGWLVFSAATPGQGGYGHVAERPESAWREELAARGLVEATDKTAALRAVATLPWLKSNLMCWRRPAGSVNDGD